MNQVFSQENKTLKNIGKLEEKYWKSQGILSVRKSGNPVYISGHPIKIFSNFNLNTFTAVLNGVETRRGSRFANLVPASFSGTFVHHSCNVLSGISVASHLMRVAMAQGEQGIGMSIFHKGKPQGIYIKLLKLCFSTGNLPSAQGNF